MPEVRDRLLLSIRLPRPATDEEASAALDAALFLLPAATDWSWVRPTDAEMATMPHTLDPLDNQPPGLDPADVDPLVLDAWKAEVETGATYAGLADWLLDTGYPPAVLEEFRAALEPLIAFRDRHLEVGAGGACLREAAMYLDRGFDAIDEALRSLENHHDFDEDDDEHDGAFA